MMVANGKKTAIEKRKRKNSLKKPGLNKYKIRLVYVSVLK